MIFNSFSCFNLYTYIVLSSGVGKIHQFWSTGNSFHKKKRSPWKKKRKCFHQGHFFDKWEMLLVSRSILSVVPHQTLATTPKCAPWTHPCRDQPRFVRMRGWRVVMFGRITSTSYLWIFEICFFWICFFFDSFDRKHYKFRSLVHCCWWVVSPTRFLSNYLYRQNWIRSIPQVWLGRDFSDPQSTLKKSTFAFLGHWSWQWYDKRRGDLHPPQWIKSNDLFFEISSRKLSGISCTKIHYLLPFWGKRCHEV